MHPRAYIDTVITACYRTSSPFLLFYLLSILFIEPIQLKPDDASRHRWHAADRMRGIPHERGLDQYPSGQLITPFFLLSHCQTNAWIGKIILKCSSSLPFHKVYSSVWEYGISRWINNVFRIGSIPCSSPSLSLFSAPRWCTSSIVRPFYTLWSPTYDTVISYCIPTIDIVTSNRTVHLWDIGNEWE